METNIFDSVASPEVYNFPLNSQPPYSRRKKKKKKTAICSSHQNSKIYAEPRHAKLTLAHLCKQSKFRTDSVVIGLRELYTLSGRQLCQEYFASLLKRDLVKKEKICSP